MTVEATGMAPNKVCAFLLGSHKSSLSIPLPLRIGAHTALQTLIIDPTANAERLVLTNGLLVELGW